MEILLLLFFLFAATTAEDKSQSLSSSSRSSIVFTTLGRSRYAFDIFTLPIFQPTNNSAHDELQITDGQSVNYNGYFPSPNSTSSLLSILSNNQTPFIDLSPSSQLLLYVTERHGFANIYLDSLSYGTPNSRRSVLQIQSQRLHIPMLNPNRISIKDRPSISGEHLIYVSTHEDSKAPRKSWAAVYSTRIGLGETRRLTPYGLADFSPAVSPSGIWTAVASSGEKRWDGEIEELDTDIYIFKTLDGSGRIKIVEHGGWPSWVDDSTFYYHRSGDDGWWSVYRATLKITDQEVHLIKIDRVTPPGLHAFTPATSLVNKNFIAVATRRPDSDFRHIELFDIARNEFIQLTRLVSPNTHHYNPFISPDGNRVGYHRCRGGGNGGKGGNTLMLESQRTEMKQVSLFRIDGSFPSFSPDGNRIAYVRLPGFYVVNSDGSGKKMILSRNAFSTAWDWKRKGVVYTSIGPEFSTETTDVDIISINVDANEPNSSYKKLTVGGKNNAFPSASPDGKWIVFRSGRSGHKNLYVMDALDGETAGLRRLTEGPWIDTMCNWSPDGEWIAFSSDRDNPGSGSFAIYVIHPNGTGLKKVIHSGENGRSNHPWFSPDSKNLVFTTDYAAVSAEPIANPHHYQPYGDIYVAKLDGSDIQRLTHNSYEDGTPAWGPTFIKPVDVAEFPSDEPPCGFDDCHWLRISSKLGVVDSSRIGCRP